MKNKLIVIALLSILMTSTAFARHSHHYHHSTRMCNLVGATLTSAIIVDAIKTPKEIIVVQQPTIQQQNVQPQIIVQQPNATVVTTESVLVPETHVIYSPKIYYRPIPPPDLKFYHQRHYPRRPPSRPPQFNHKKR